MSYPRTSDPIARVVGVLAIVTTISAGGVAWGVNRASVEALVRSDADTRASVATHAALPGHAEGIARLGSTETEIVRMRAQLDRIEASVAATREDVAAMRGRAIR